LLEWSGPSFSDGIDSARVVFRFPEAPTPPHAPSQNGAEPSNIVDDSSGVFLSYARRGAGKHELEVVRPHLAKNEVVVWKAVVDPSTFDPMTKPTVETPAAPEPKVELPTKARPPERRSA